MGGRVSQEQQPHSDAIQAPPRTFWGIVGRLGPGLIIAGSIVGSGELIATTKTGAEAGFWLLWLIVIGCVIKVFAQVEFGRYTIVTGRTTMDGMNEVPGPRLPGAGSNWIIWYWFLMFVASISQLGGIVGAVGQALAISVPLTQQGREFNEYVDLTIGRQIRHTAVARDAAAGAPQMAPEDRRALQREIQRVDNALAERDAELIRVLGATEFERLGHRPPVPPDDKIWAAIIAFVTAVVLVVGRYRLVQAFSTAIVALFTLVTVINLGLLQSHPTWCITWSDIAQGLSFRLPPAGLVADAAPVATALATFGIIGVGAAELIAYPYWCLEKGYARFTGPRDESVEWGERARGWMRVMRWDVWGSMVVYTFATIAFYLLGAAVLGRAGLNPQKNELIQTLNVMYEPVFGNAAQMLFLFGAFAVLYSTYFVANAGHARVFPDALRVLIGKRQSPAQYQRLVKLLSGVFPLVCLVIYVLFPHPTVLVLWSGVMQAIMLPMLAVAALFFRYRRCDARLTPGMLWDLFLWLSAAGMFVAGIWTLISKLGGLSG